MGLGGLGWWMQASRFLCVVVIAMSESSWVGDKARSQGCRIAADSMFRSTDGWGGCLGAVSDIPVSSPSGDCSSCHAYLMGFSCLATLYWLCNVTIHNLLVLLFGPHIGCLFGQHIGPLRFGHNFRSTGLVFGPHMLGSLCGAFHFTLAFCISICLE